MGKKEFPQFNVDFGHGDPIAGQFHILNFFNTVLGLLGKQLEKGQILPGTVSSIVDFGAFVDLGGIDGLLHITDMSWGRINHPSELFHVGDEIKVKVLKFDSDSERVSLGLKQIQPDPWVDAGMRYPIGVRMQGKVVSLTDYGAFVEIEPGIDGLVHVSDMSWTKRVEHPSEIVQKGQDLEVMVLDVDAENKRISLGIKQLQDDPWPGISERFTPDTEWTGNVARVQDNGVVMDLGDDIEGLFFLSQLAQCLGHLILISHRPGLNCHRDDRFWESNRL